MEAKLEGGSLFGLLHFPPLSPFLSLPFLSSCWMLLLYEKHHISFYGLHREYKGPRMAMDVDVVDAAVVVVVVVVEALLCLSLAVFVVALGCCYCLFLSVQYPDVPKPKCVDSPI